MILLEDNPTNDRLRSAVERAVVISANAAEQAARGCRAIVVKHWRTILGVIEKGGSVLFIRSKINDAIRAATRDIIAHMDSSFGAIAEQSFDLVDKATFESLTPAAAKTMAEGFVDDYLSDNDP